ncbi:olfactory receptor class A-like protein 1 [Ambystoma mexicanum]|uniref:olfactory receptor class A-like protein 1 n=1 Tax=Ambystoma mexicanum TaxID=8296 RepID=UPI0037E777CF
MDARLILKAIGFLTLDAIGIPGNMIILASFIHLRIGNGKLMPIDVILCKLSFVNLVVVVVRGIPQSLNTLGIRKLFDQDGCNFIILAYRVSRAMSICLTSLLSCYQWIILAPTSGFWPTIRSTFIRRLLPIMASVWCLNIVIYVYTMYSYSWGLYRNSTVHVLNLDFCLVLFPSFSAFLVTGTVYLVRDFISIALMVLSSLCIVVVLYRHSQQVKSIRSPHQKIKNSAESRAAKSVLMLVSTYVFFFGLDNGIWFYTICVDASANAVLSDARVFFGSCYSALSPLVVIATNTKIQLKLRFPFSRKPLESPETTVSHVST